MEGSLTTVLPLWFDSLYDIAGVILAKSIDFISCGKCSVTVLFFFTPYVAHRRINKNLYSFAVKAATVYKIYENKEL